MGKITFSVALSGLFIAYISYSIWTIGKLFFPPNCDTTQESCISAYIASKPKLQLVLLTSTTSKPRVDTQFSLLEQIDPFDYLAEAERVIDVRLPIKTRRNGTLYLHAFLTRHRNDGDWRTALSDSYATYTSFDLTEYQVPVAQAFNLLGDRNDTNSKPAQLDIPVTHLKTRVVVNVLSHLDPLPAKDLPMDLGHLLILSPKGSYLPTVYIDVLSSRLKDLVQINSSMTEYPVSFGFSPISLGKLRLWLQFSSALQTLKLAGFTSKDIDEIKGIFTDTNVIFLCMTFFIAGIHLLFDFLAFKNDVAFWKSRENMVGLSTRTLLWRAFSQWVIVLYLMDENTSLLVLVPAIIGAIIEVWKVCKAFKVHVVWSNYIPRIRLGHTTNEEEETEKFDVESMKYLSYLLYPLCIAGAVYSLFYNPHRSWYSWVVNSLVNGVYAFGFLFMLPQLFVNYRLKSVAHLPWRAFMYKAFNTFIDDVFSFLITMPTAHRVACFRDDIVFLIYLYQRWLYPVDKTRVNEFGSTGEEDEKKTN